MRGLRVLAVRGLGCLSRHRRDPQLEAEIREHLHRLTEDHLRRGLAPHEARAAARREFGGVDQMTERYRDQWGLRWLDTLARDLRVGGRSLRRTPGVTATIVVTLAIAIGANTAIFSLVNAVILKPFDYDGAARLVTIHEALRKIPAAPLLPVNAAHFEEWRQTTRSIERMALIREINVNLTGTGEPERLTAGRVSASRALRDE